jgi:hypothetical protein
MLPAFRAGHCRQIAFVIEALCDTSRAESEESETFGIIGTFLHAAVAVEGMTTRGNTAQRYEAAVALRRDVDDVTGRAVGPARYLLDGDELVIAVSDLADAARRHVGSSLPRGWLDARIEGIGWERITLAGYAQPGRSGRRGPHARLFAYRGTLPNDEDL